MHKLPNFKPSHLLQLLKNCYNICKFNMRYYNNNIILKLNDFHNKSLLSKCWHVSQILTINHETTSTLIKTNKIKIWKRNLKNQIISRKCCKPYFLVKKCNYHHHWINFNNQQHPVYDSRKKMISIHFYSLFIITFISTSNILD